MRTPIILVSLLAIIALISSQENCYSEVSQVGARTDRKVKNFFEVGNKEASLENQVLNLDPSSVFSKPISRNTARIAWYLALIITALFSMLKLFRLMGGTAPLWTLKMPLILINCIIAPLIWIYCLYDTFAKAFYLKEGSLYEIIWICFTLIIACGYQWIYVNQCASGSRAFLAQGILLTGTGLLGVSVAIINKGKLSFAFVLLVVGLFTLIPSLLRSAKEFRVSARLLKQGIPIQLGFSILLVIAVCAAYVAGDIVAFIKTNWKYSLYQLLMFVPFTCFLLVPIYWGWRWRDGLALRFYQLFLVTILIMATLILPSSGVAKPVGAVDLILLAGAFFISIALTFHSSVRKWARELKPAF